MKNNPISLAIVCIASLLCLSRPATAQVTSSGFPGAEDSVKATINRLFAAMRNSDAEGLRAVFTDSAILQTIVADKQGKVSVRSYPVADFAATIGRLPNGAADERVSFDVIKIDGPLAIVWAPYQFYYSGKLSHCGIDSFQLLQTNGEWKILYIVDTRRTDCKQM